ncbi:hypothetical protein LVJ94_13220 [Pendulispora rubella]|uniref:PI3K/PI4K catalytic domain-containing protein n=1 Tax=Pendulispora rubella TaxID=2741070 RepID=A0ABZ2LEH6_9BACT
MKRAALWVVLAALVACNKAPEEPSKTETAKEPPKAETPKEAPKTEAPAPAASDAADAAPPKAKGESPPPKVVLEESAFSGATPTSATSIGHTSVVFKVDFSNGQRGAWKPRSKRGKLRYKGEIAAYRLGRALALPNVPLAFPYRIAKKDLSKATKGKDASLLDEEAIAESDGTVRGALIPWIAKLEFYPVETEKSRAEWEPWLFTGAEIPDKDWIVAGDISTLIAFDLITGNWDRWSGANLGANGPGGHLLFIDNDGAFFDPVPPGPLAKQTALLERTERFSRSFVEALRKLEGDALPRAFGEESGEPLLSAAVLKGVAARRATVLSIIDKKIVARGDKAVLFFP